jgi:hypothetical protein
MWVGRLSHGLCYLIDTVAEPQKLAPVGLRAVGLLAVELCAPVGAQLVELRVKRLAVDADNGRIRGGGFAGLFRSRASRNDCPGHVDVALIDRAEHEIDMAAYVLTDWPVMQALTRAADSRCEGAHLSRRAALGL